MKEREGLGFFLEIVVVVVMLSTLSAVAMPSIGKMINKSRVAGFGTELDNIQTAVTAMLAESDAGVLVPVGPTADMSKVKTADMVPLVLTDYLRGLDETVLESGCTYKFTANGTVTQILP